MQVPPRPDNLETFKISLEVRLNDVPRSWTEDLVPYEYFTTPIPISMLPTMAPRAGGINLYVAGAFFYEHPDLRCRFGETGPVVSG